jgi:hypothetical protein
MRGIANALFLFCLSALAGCGALPDLPWMESGAPTERTADAPIYCYGTLADPDCYATPQAGWNSRLIGFYGSKPAGLP